MIDAIVLDGLDFLADGCVIMGRVGDNAHDGGGGDFFFLPLSPFFSFYGQVGLGLVLRACSFCGRRSFATEDVGFFLVCLLLLLNVFLPREEEAVLPPAFLR